MAAEQPERCFRFSIDRGGTFTDVFADCGNGVTTVLKLLSEDPANYADAPREGIRRVLEKVTGIPHPRDRPLDTSRIHSIRMGTTVATNALLERKGERIALVITSGFKDLLQIGNQSRPRIFDLEIRKPELLYETVVEVDERVVLVTPDAPRTENDSVVTGVTGEEVRIEKAPDVEAVRRQLQAVYDTGIRSLAIVFMHAYTFRDHERIVGEVAKEIGFTHVSLSSEVMPMVKIVPRGFTTCVDAYLTPVLLKYIRSFSEGFDENFDKVLVTFMQSDGGLTPVTSFSGNKAILSGPAGGVVGFSATAYDPETRQPLIGFDMGGTSTDVSRFAGEFEHVFETTTAGVTIQSPQLDINTVAAGGGSKLFFNNGLFVVGPDSVGAHPGPVCYRKGGQLAVTDANLVLGRLLPQYFPKLFGPNENEPLDAEGTRRAFEALAEEINAHAKANGMATKTVEEIALGYLQVANEAMCRPIRNLTNMKGYDVTTHALVCFGGAGPQHCCAIAKALGMRRVIVHPYSGILSAYGLSMADLVVERQMPTAEVYSPESLERCKAKLQDLETDAKAELHKLGFSDDRITVKYFLNLRYSGTDTAIMTGSTPEGGKDTDFRSIFEAQYKREFGFLLESRSLLVDDVRVSAVGHTTHTAKQKIAVGTAPPEPIDNVRVYFQEGWLDTPVFNLEKLLAQQVISGPAIIMQDVATVVVEPGAEATIKDDGTLEIIIKDAGSAKLTTERDPIYLSIFSHRFMGIAEQMGRTLQRTSVSVNIKERLDFSCALFDSAGGLVANAPHLPVHLGAMSEAVRYQIKYWGDDLAEGDVLVSNHPQLAGGSHLPDITVITPVFHNGKIVFFVASRGHHADVGGIAPGSMPPLSRTLEQEGAAIVAFKLVTGGVFQEEGITELLQAPGRLPGNSGTRNLSDNLNDLRAQVAANKRGVALMGELIAEYGMDVVQAYMEYIQQSAEAAVRDMLYEFSLRQGLRPVDTVRAQDFMDDGTPVCLAVTIDRETRSAIFDFEGTGPEIFGNLNAPPSVTASAVIYCLRCLIPNMDIPLNQGCLWPVEIRIPPNSILNPSPTAAVVGGNVLTSQRVTDVILKAFQACAASQGCMNNLTFGDKTLGYYETIAGGAGAGPTWHGCSGVHTHMTNTRITDPEILERRLPAILREFGLRTGSGGAGAFRGGDGVVRRLQFRRPLTVSILSERRAFAPFGMAGGHDGARGLNLLTFAADGRTVNLGGKNTVQVQSGDVLTILSPGGGGWGTPADEPAASDAPQTKPLRLATGSVHEYTRRQETA